MIDFDWQTIVMGASLVIGLASLSLSIYSLYVQRRDKRPRLTVMAIEDIAVTTRMQGTFLLGTSMRRDDAGQPAGAGEPVVGLELSNLGDKTVRVVEVRMV